MANANLSQEQLRAVADQVAVEINRAQALKGRLKLDLPTFSGAKGPLDAQAFLKDAEGYKEACGLSDGQCVQAVQFALRDAAKVWGANLAMTVDLQTVSWENYKRYFEKRFGLSMSPSEKAKLVEGLKQKPEESVRAFYDRCQSAELVLAESNSIYRQANEDTKTRMREQGICDKFLRGLKEAGDLKGAVNSMAPAQGQEAVSLQEYYEAAIQKEQSLADKKSGLSVFALSQQADVGKSDMQSKMEDVEKKLAELQMGRGKFDLSKVRCFGCNQLGHTIRFCRARGAGRGRGGPPTTRGGRGRFGGSSRQRGGFRSGSAGGFQSSRSVGALEALRAITDTLVEEENWPRAGERDKEASESIFGRGASN